jgi:hypothetical protein
MLRKCATRLRICASAATLPIGSSRGGTSGEPFAQALPNAVGFLGKVRGLFRLRETAAVPAKGGVFFDLALV